MKSLTKTLAVISTLSLSIGLQAQSNTEGVSIKTSISPPHPSAMLDVESSTKGVLIPRLSLGTLSDTSSVSHPADALLVFNTNTVTTGGLFGKGIYYWDRPVKTWTKLSTDNTGATGTSLWSKIGSGPDIYYSAGKVRIGASTPTPTYALEVLKPSDNKVFRFQGQYGELLFHSTSTVYPPWIYSTAAALSTGSSATPSVNISGGFTGLATCYGCSSQTVTESVLTQSVDVTTDHATFIQRFSDTDLGISLSSSKNNGYSAIKSGTGRSLYIQSEGSVSMGGTAGLSLHGSAVSINSGSHIVFFVNGGSGIFLFNGSSGTMTFGSDSTLKTHITDAPAALSNLLLIRPVKYNLKTTPNQPKINGFIAQELEAVFPELVTTVKAGITESASTVKSVNYEGLISILVKGMQEQQAQIEALTDRVKTLEAH